jgi:tRNA (guanine37-N1)-methyltransferase
MRLDFVSLFPDLITPFLNSGVIGRAVRSGLVRSRVANPRDYCYDRHAKVDDHPFGGEPGMVLRAEPVALAVESLEPEWQTVVVLTDPAGELFRQQDACEMAEQPHVIFLCGHYEGIDDRVARHFQARRYSIGDFVLTGGELPAAIMADAVARHVPGVLGNPESLEADSHSGGLLTAPNYTRPEQWRGHEVPPVLLSGDHQAIARSRREFALRVTRERRPDLFAKARLEPGDLNLLQ